MVGESIDWLALLGESLVPGLVAIALTGILVRSWSALGDLRVQRKYPIAGTYIATFGDSNSDARDSDIYWGTDNYTEAAELDQSGTSVTGTSRTQYRTYTATWDLDGEITEDGYIVGRYTATNPHDQGHGMFFLYIRKNRHLRGIWAGYEDEGGEINHGEYEFKPTLKVPIQDLPSTARPVTVNLLEMADADERTIEKVTRASDDRAGFTLVAYTEGASSSRLQGVRRVYRSILDFTDRGSGGTALRYADRRLVGVVVTTVSSDGISDTLSIPGESLPTAVSCATTIGLIDFVAVDEQYRERGIGTQLVEAAVERFERESVEAICVVADGREQAAIGGLMNWLGFDEYLLDGEHRHEPPGSGESDRVIYAKFNH